MNWKHNPGRKKRQALMEIDKMETTEANEGNEDHGLAGFPSSFLHPPSSLPDVPLAKLPGSAEPRPTGNPAFNAGILGCAMGMLLIVSQRRCVQILGPGSDSPLASSLVFFVGLGLGWNFFRKRGKIAKIPPFVNFVSFCKNQFVAILVLSTMAAVVLGQRLAP